MDASGGIIARWILLTLIIFASLQRYDAIRWTTAPNKPKILVQGVNNTNIPLAWDFVLDSGETLQKVLFQRQKPGERATTIASKDANSSSSFTLYNSEYRADNPNTLLLLEVNNNEEYIYSIVVMYVRVNVSQYTDQVQVIVYVPPRITKEPVRNSEVNAGQNLILTCNADGDPKPNITWTKDNVPQNQFNYFGSALRLVNVQGKDTGPYRCTARNAYGTATAVAFVNMKCPLDQCQVLHVGITITNVEWKEAFANNISVEHKMLASNLSSAIGHVYSLPQNAAIKLFQVNIVQFRQMLHMPGSTIAIVQLQFEKDVLDPLKPLSDDITDGAFGPFKVARQLDFNPITTPGTHAVQRPSNAGADRKSPITRGIAGGTIFLVIIRAVIN